MLPELKTFISIVETDNVIKVMENLNLSKATVYEHLKYLEQFFRVNIALISRNNEITITESGNLLYKRAKQIFNIIDDTPGKLIENNNDDVVGSIKIGVNSVLEEYFLPKFLSEFLKKYPNINIDIFTDSDKNILNKLRNNEIDIGLIEELYEKNTLMQNRFLREKMVLIIPYANTIKDISTYMNELKSKRWITREDNCSTKHFIDLFLKENHLKPESMLTLGSDYAIKEAVKNKLGISIIPKLIAEPSYKNEDICILPLESYYEKYFTYVLNDNNHSKSTTIFLNELKNFCKHFYR